MSDVGQVLIDMQAAGLPSPPNDVLITDGKIHKYGKGKKAWYALRELTLRSGQRVLTGAFGLWQGNDSGEIKVRSNMSSLSKEDIADYHRKQRESATKEREDKRRAAQLAANRAQEQWNEADGVPLQHPYLERKQITPEAVRVSEDGLLLIPAWRDGQLVAVNKIDEAGGKRFNFGSDTIGASLTLGTLAGAAVIGVGEGYATSRTIRMLSFPADFPVEVAFTAGNIVPVALRLRKAHPDAHLLFFADDDYLVEPQFIAYLAKNFNVLVAVAVDGETHVVHADDGEMVEVMARWMTDAQGVEFISADVRKGRVSRTPKFENAGVSRCRAAAAAVGNASVMVPVFADRGGRKISDINDLAVEESFDIAAAQIGVAILAAKQPKPDFPVMPAALAATPIDLDLSGEGGAVEYPLPPAAEQPDFALSTPAAAPAAVLDLSVLFAEGVVAESPPPPVAEQPAGRSADGAEAAPASGPSLAAVLEVPFNGERPPEPVLDAGEAVAGGEGGGESGQKEKPKKVYGQAHWDQVDWVLRNFILVYGEDLVWDVGQRMLMKTSSMRTIVANSDVMKFWSGDARCWVLKKNIVFDPRDMPSPASSGATATVNLFNGWRMKPKRGTCLQIQTLIAHLCDGNDELVTWVERWLAYPLRNRGAKMETSIIMHGDEGSGKNFFFEKVIKKIYGEYGYVIGNAQLESQFNDWASMKLFMVADEVVTRSELKHMKGKLKYLVSGDMIIINPKGLPEHGEANHMNFVFLSNELQPLALDKTDRRYLVIWTPPALGREFYVEVAKEIEAGGIEAYFHYLMHELDMGDFDEHSKPLYTDAKDDLIEKSLTPAERFYRDWSRGFLPLPFITCGATQLYDAYKVWCDKSGESKYISQTIFSPTVLRYAGDALEKRVIKYDLGHVVKQRNVFLCGVKPEGKTLSDWVADASALFEKQLGAYRSRSTANVEGEPIT